MYICLCLDREMKRMNRIGLHRMHNTRGATFGHRNFGVLFISYGRRLVIEIDHDVVVR